MSTQKSWFSIQAKSESEAEVLIYDAIGAWGVTAKRFAEELKPHASKDLVVRINSPGGVITEGTAIFNALRRHKGKVTTAIDGLAASMGSYVALAGSTVRMAENAWYMIHNPSGYAGGEAKDMRKYADLLDRMKATLVAAYVAKTGLDEAEVEKMMDDETWLTASEAKEKGFIDEITEPVEAEAIAKFDLKAFKHAPAALVGGNVDTPTGGKPVMNIEQLQARVKELEGQLTEARNQHTAAADQAKTNHTKVQDLTNQVTNLTQERDQYKAEVDKLKAEAKSAEARALDLVAGLGVTSLKKENKKEGDGPKAGSPEAVYAEYMAIEDEAERRKFFVENKALIFEGQARASRQ